MINVSLLDVREGRNQLRTLAAIAERYRRGQRSRVKDLTEMLGLSKGAVSNNCKKLLKHGVVREENKEYWVDEAVLLEAYREHLEQYLVRGPASELFPEEVDEKNRMRTRAKQNLDRWFQNSRVRETLLEILMQSLLAVRRHSMLQMLREVFFYADRLVQKTHRKMEEDLWEGKGEGTGGDLREALDHLANAIDWGSVHLDSVFQTMTESGELFQDGDLRPQVQEKLEEFCREHGIRKLSLFGSALTDEFSPVSDLDVLVEFEPDQKPGGFEFVGMENELSDLLGRPVDLVIENGRDSDFLDRAREQAKVQYEAGS